MTTFQMGLTIAVCTAATMLTRFLSSRPRWYSIWAGCCPPPSSEC